MAAETDSFVLDTSALFCLKDNEEGAHDVRKLLIQEHVSSLPYVSFASCMEYFYVVYQEMGREDAFRSYLELKMLPIQVVESSEPLRLIAGEIKVLYPLSFADAWVAATAEYLGATLVHKDPEFKVLSKRVALKALPYRKRSHS